MTDNEKQNQFSNWATSQGIALNSSQLAETIRSHKVTEGIDQQNANTSQQNANTAAAGAGATVAPYDQAKDLALVNSSQFIDSGAASAPYLRLLANSGIASQTDVNFDAFLNGTPSASQSWITTVGLALWNPINPKIVIKPNTAVPGALALPEADFNQVLQLIKDPIRQGEAYALWAVKNNLYTTTADAIKEVAQANGWTAPQTTLALKFLGGK